LLGLTFRENRNLGIIGGDPPPYLTASLICADLRSQLRGLAKKIEGGRGYPKLFYLKTPLIFADRRGQLRVWQKNLFFLSEKIPPT